MTLRLLAFGLFSLLIFFSQTSYSNSCKLENLNKTFTIEKCENACSKASCNLLRAINEVLEDRKLAMATNSNNGVHIIDWSNLQGRADPYTGYITGGGGINPCEAAIDQQTILACSEAWKKVLTQFNINPCGSNSACGEEHYKWQDFSQKYDLKKFVIPHGNELIFNKDYFDSSVDMFEFSKK